MNGFAGALFLLTSLVSPFAIAGTCELYRNYVLKSERPPVEGAPVQEWQGYHRDLAQLLTTLAQTTTRNYFSEQAWTSPESCGLSPEQREKFEEYLQEELEQASLAEVGTWGPLSRRFVTKLKNREDLSPFRVFTDFEENITEEKMRAGYHRGSKTIHMDLSQIPSREWPVIFVHEKAHSMDKELQNSIEIYGDLETAKLIDAIVAGQVPLLSQQQTSILEKWAVAGLNRGFLAEVRAWSVTLALYQEAQKSSKAKLAWVDVWLQKKLPTETLPAFTFRTLDPRFTQPAISPYHHPMIRKIYESVRQDLRTGRRRIQILGFF